MKNIIMTVIQWTLKNISIIKDIILAVAGIIGSTVAIFGYSSWKKQMRKKVDYELAKDILITIYTLRDSIASVRNPFLLAEEQAVSKEYIEKTKTPEDMRTVQIGSAYQKRWEGVELNTSKLYVRIIEAEVMWGIEIRDSFNKLMHVVNELFVTIRMYIDDIRNNREKRMKPNDLQKRNEIIYSTGNPEEDRYYKKLIDKIEIIETYLRQKLKL